ncbi:hypothetical protein OESDEN_25182, partial [Oesophagostomum dentatum]
MKSLAVLRSVSRLAVQAAKLGVVTRVPVRAISTSQRAFNVGPELTQALTREIQAEQQLSQENLGGSAAPSFHGFNITTKNAEVRLTKQHGKERLAVL